MAMLQGDETTGPCLILGRKFEEHGIGKSDAGRKVCTSIWWVFERCTSIQAARVPGKQADKLTLGEDGKKRG